MYLFKDFLKPDIKLNKYIITQANKIKVIFCNLNTNHGWYLSCPDLKNENYFYFYGHNFSESGIPVFNWPVLSIKTRISEWQTHKKKKKMIVNNIENSTEWVWHSSWCAFTICVCIRTILLLRAATRQWQNPWNFVKWGEFWSSEKEFFF